VVTVVSPLRSSGEGTHQITLRLTPEDLGSVDATVTVRGGQVVVSLTADNPAAKQALAAALPQLRHELGTEGNPATVFVSDGSTESQNGPNQYSDTTHPTLTTDAEAPEEEPVAVTVATSGPHSVDIRL
jgi:flagellar hook-length control protein FliK